MHRTFYEYLMTLRNPNDHSEIAEFAKNAFWIKAFLSKKRITID